jgi:hypothetical protein
LHIDTAVDWRMTDFARTIGSMKGLGIESLLRKSQDEQDSDLSDSSDKLGMTCMWRGLQPQPVRNMHAVVA